MQTGFGLLIALALVIGGGVGSLLGEGSLGIVIGLAVGVAGALALGRRDAARRRRAEPL